LDFEWRFDWPFQQPVDIFGDESGMVMDIVFLLK